jgi:tetratricopeptide (TPR) repeat protein
MRSVFSSLVALALLGTAPMAHADEHDHKRAVELDAEGAAAYKAGRFAEAIAKLREAVALDPNPILLFNLARVYESSGDLDHALESFRGYLAGDPTAEDRGAVEKRIATLERQIRERDAARAAPPPPPPSHAAPTLVIREARRPSAAPWIVASAGAAAVGVGGAFGVMALTTHDSAVNDPVQATAADAQANAKTFATVANVLFVAGAVVLVTGVVWGLIDVAGSKHSRATRAATLRFLRGEVLVW